MIIHQDQESPKKLPRESSPKIGSMHGRFDDGSFTEPIKSNYSPHRSKSASFKRALFKSGNHNHSLSILPNSYDKTQLWCHRRSFGNYGDRVLKDHRTKQLDIQKSLEYDMTKNTFDKNQEVKYEHVVEVPKTPPQNYSSSHSTSRRNKRFIGNCFSSLQVDKLQQQQQIICQDSPRNDKNEHEDGKLFKCTSCNMNFKYFSNLKSHFVVVHNFIRTEHNRQSLTRSAESSLVDNKNKMDGIYKGLSKNDNKSTTTQSYKSNFVVDNTKCLDGDLVGNSRCEKLLFGLSLKHSLYFCKICEKFFKFEVNLRTHQATVHFVERQLVNAQIL